MDATTPAKETLTPVVREATDQADAIGHLMDEIVRDSIATATLVDDDYIDAFDKSPAALTHEYYETTKELYYGLRENGCVPNVYHFAGPDKWSVDNKKIGLLKGKDLLILDWELTKSGDKNADALRVLTEAVINEGLPFICIYTRTPDIELVPLHILSYFTGRTKTDREETVNQLGNWALEHNVRGLTDFFISLASLFHNYILASSPGKRADIAKTVRKETNKLPWENIGEGKPGYEALYEFAQKEIKIKNEWEFYVLLASRFKQGEPGTSLTRTETHPVEGEQFVYRINNSIVIIFPNKDGDAKYPLIEPTRLYGKITDIIKKRDYLTLLSLEIRNAYRAQSMAIGRNISDIEECAFFHHERNFKGNNVEFNRFVQDLWESEMSLFYNNIEPRMKQKIDDYKVQRNISTRLETFSGSDNRFDELGALNYNLTILRNANSTGNIRFGDIFAISPPIKTGRKDDHMAYAICITPGCDCAHPEGVIFNFIFIGGIECNLSTALDNPEGGYFSYVKVKDEIKAIAWDRHFLFSVNIPTDKNEIGKTIVCRAYDRDISMEYLAHQKNNYAQRVANDFLGWANRVGISCATKHDLSKK